jgi:niacin transporter
MITSPNCCFSIFTICYLQDIISAEKFLSMENQSKAASTGIPFRALRFGDARLYAFVAAFTALDVLLPWLTHHFGGVQAGCTFLPMHIFVLLAGLLFGWRAGLLVGLFTPLISFGVSAMPPSAILPQITVELICYGLAAGILREKFNLRIIWSLLGAMLIGRLTLGLAVLLFSWGGVNPLLYVWSVIQQGWPGIVIQLIIVPPLAKVLNNRWQRRLNARQ